jgi:hypothetical protein
MAGMEGSLQALGQVLFAPQFDDVVARLDVAEVERSVRPRRTGVSLVDENLGTGDRAVDLDRTAGELRRLS